MDKAQEEGVQIHQDVLDKALEGYELDGDLYDQFKAQGMEMPGVIRGPSRKELRAQEIQEQQKMRRHFDYLATQRPASTKPVKKDNGLKQRLRELQRSAALGKAGE